MYCINFDFPRLASENVKNVNEYRKCLTLNLCQRTGYPYPIVSKILAVHFIRMYTLY